VNRIQSVRSKASEEDGMNCAKHRIYRWKLPAHLPWKGADIEFRNVHFTYPTRSLPVLKGISFAIHHGQFAAIVGGSGSGKTTVISLLQRFYEPTLGSIWQDGNRITSIPLSVLRKRMSLVAQETYLFRGTIRENVLLGIDEGIVTNETMHLACRNAGIHSFIVSLPDGYDTDIGTGGVSLSGGQKQRISIARALIRDPAVLLLDEATSSLDSQTEKEVQAVFERTGKGKTIICVAHRLATVQRADVIFVMHQGSIVEKGDHQSLLRLGGTYWQMCQAQSLID
jgi:ATP-binding cassette subfamily B (MDR/TAP) protein 1